MTMGSVVHVDWLNENRNRKYPFWDQASLRDDTGTMTLPNELIVDLVFPIDISEAGANLHQFHLSQLVVFEGGVIISLGFAGTTIATRSISAADHTENQSYAISGVSAGGYDFSDSTGQLSIGRFDEINKYGGTYTFSVANARLLPTLLRPSMRGVSGIRTVDASNETSDLITGIVELVAGDNILLERVAANQLRVSAINNPAYDAECACPDITTGDPILTINGIGPDGTGDFTINGTGCVAISSESHGIKITDTCAEPCCGCRELDVLRNEVGRLGKQISTQSAFAQRAQGSVEQLRDVILSSKLGSVLPCD